ncbi:MAG: DNA cytosine methyltransferase [Candidatus Jordarchaeaceae archaeon]
MTDKFTHFSLFTGAGGIDAGFRETGKYRTVFGNDIKPDAVKTYSSNFNAEIIEHGDSVAVDPAVYLGSIETIDFNKLSKYEIDVVTGGPPCQDFSLVRGPQSERGGITVKRGKLYAHFIRALIHLRPKVFVFENVPGLITANNGEAYKSIIEDFSCLNIRWNEIKEQVRNGADIIPTNYEILFSDIVDATKAGVPQARRRLIIIGLRKDLANKIWWKISELKKMLSKALNDTNSCISKYPLTTIETFEGQPLCCLEETYSNIMREYKSLAEEIETHQAWQSNLPAQSWKVKFKKLSFDIFQDYKLVTNSPSLTRQEFLKISEEHELLLKELGYYGKRVTDLKLNNTVKKTSMPVVERMKRIPPGENHEFVRGTPWEVEGKGMSLIYRRLHPLKPAYTVVAYGGGGTWGYHYERNRDILTDRERARIQTFPDDFVFIGNSSEVRAQIGEAVPPLLAKRIGQAVCRIIEAVGK